MPKNASRTLPLIAILAFVAFIATIIERGSETGIMAALTVGTLLPATLIIAQLVFWQERMKIAEEKGYATRKTAGGIELFLFLAVMTICMAIISAINDSEGLSTLITLLAFLMIQPMIAIWVHQRRYVNRVYKHLTSS